MNVSSDCSRIRFWARGSQVDYFWGANHELRWVGVAADALILIIAIIYPRVELVIYSSANGTLYRVHHEVAAFSYALAQSVTESVLLESLNFSCLA